MEIEVKITETIGVIQGIQAKPEINPKIPKPTILKLSNAVFKNTDLSNLEVPKSKPITKPRARIIIINPAKIRNIGREIMVSGKRERTKLYPANVIDKPIVYNNPAKNPFRRSIFSFARR